MKFREKILASGAHLILGKDEESNEELVRKFEGKPNTILHTVAPGSPFCVIDGILKPTSMDIVTSGAWCARYSQDWRDNKSDIRINIFTGKDVYKSEDMPIGTFGVKKSKLIKIKKEEIQELK